VTQGSAFRDLDVGLRDLGYRPRRIRPRRVQVTHDRELAARCDRTIELIDGRIAR